jgi:hypothetical protein
MSVWLGTRHAENSEDHQQAGECRFNTAFPWAGYLHARASGWASSRSQVSARKFVIPFYVMTRDLKRDLPAEKFTVTVKGLGARATFSAYDPIRDARDPVHAISVGDDTVKLEVSARDYPILLEVKEQL